MEQKSSCRFFPVGGKGKMGYVWWLLVCGWWYGVCGWSSMALPRQAVPDRFPHHDTLRFFGESIVLPAVSAEGFPHCRGWSRKKVERYYRDLFETDFVKFLDFCTMQAETMRLGDWGYYLLIEQAAARYFPQDTLSASVFTCFMMRRSGYECTLTYDLRQHRVGCFVWAAQRMDYRYHLYRRGICYSQTCGMFCPGGIEMEWWKIERKVVPDIVRGDSLPRLRALDLRMSEAPLIGRRFCERRYYSYAGADSLAVTVCYNPQHLAYYACYPFTTLDVYFNTPLPAVASERLKEALMPRLIHLSLYEQANFLLHYVQFAYTYKTDHAQFGKEKYNFAEESLCYEAADCDDRSVLYAALLRLLVPEVEVVGLNFPLHVCTAVSFPGEEVGEPVFPHALEKEAAPFEKCGSALMEFLGDSADFIVWQGRRYYVADPTYVGADIGEAMPVFKRMEPEVIKVMPLGKCERER